MPKVDIFEGEKWIIKGKHKSGPFKNKTIKLTIKQIGSDASEKVVDTKDGVTVEKGGEFKYEFTTPAVADDQPNCKLVADAEYAKFLGKGRKRLPDTCTVWPKQFAVVASNDAGSPWGGVELTAKQGDRKSVV